MQIFLVQSLVQARKAGIASAMAARSSFKDEELVSSTCACSVFFVFIFKFRAALGILEI